MKRGRRNSA